MVLDAAVVLFFLIMLLGTVALAVEDRGRARLREAVDEREDLVAAPPGERECFDAWDRLFALRYGPLDSQDLAQRAIYRVVRDAWPEHFVELIERYLDETEPRDR